jgi:hypothetical protein
LCERAGVGVDRALGLARGAGGVEDHRRVVRAASGGLAWPSIGRKQGHNQQQ